MLKRKSDGKKFKVKPLSPRDEKKPTRASVERMLKKTLKETAKDERQLELPYRAVSMGTQGPTPTPLPGASSLEVVLADGTVLRVERRINVVVVSASRGAVLVRPVVSNAIEIQVEH